MRVQLLALVALSSVASAAPYRAPPLTSHVVDTANALSVAERSSLDAKMAAIRERGGGELVVFFVGDLAGVPIEDVAYTAFNQWGIGGARADNGVLLVIAPKDHRIRIETGKGVGGALTDVKSSDIIRRIVATRLREGHFAQAANDGVDAIALALSADTAPRRTAARHVRPKLSPTTMVVGAVGAGLFALLLLLSSGFRGGVWQVLQVLFFARLFGGGGGRGDGSGSGYSGGGGSSGGGGASGDF